MWFELLFLFCARTIDMSLGTLRHMFVVRGLKVAAASVGFVEIIVFTLALGLVVSAGDDPLKLLAFAGGFSFGILCGMVIEERLAIGHRAVQIIAGEGGASLAEDLRRQGHAVTVWSADGRDGRKLVLNLLLERRHAFRLARDVRERLPDAFVLLAEPKGYLGGRVPAKFPSLLPVPTMGTTGDDPRPTRTAA
jgi:uncharacterized protein YebE (UPF0316 family)